MNILFFIVWNWNLIDFLLTQSYLQIYEYQLLYLQRLPMIPSSSYIYEYQLLFFQRRPVSRSSIGADLDFLDAERSIKSHPNDNVKRRTLLMKKIDNSGWGFTLQVIWTLIFPLKCGGGLGWVMVCKET